MNIGERQEYAKQSASSTFLVRIIFTRNASMQGYIQWLEKEKTLAFRSCLELFHLLEGGLEIANREDKTKMKLRSWE